MKHLANLLLLGFILFVLVNILGCTAIGYAIGSSHDGDSNRMTLVTTKQLKVGTQAFVTLKNDENISGRVLKVDDDDKTLYMYLVADEVEKKIAFEEIENITVKHQENAGKVKGVKIGALIDVGVFGFALLMATAISLFFQGRE